MNKKKITVIGPVYPFKGGISHYTSLMCRALQKKYEIDMISYRMQYPRLLFKKEQKDDTNDSFKLEGVQYLINTVNPFSWVGTSEKIKKIDPELIIIQWWHPYFAPCYWCLAKLLYRYKIMFICHNVFPHERFPMDRFLVKRVLKQGDYFIVQSNTDAKDLQTIIKNPRFRQTVHPTYNAFCFENMDKQTARQHLHLEQDSKVILFFGFVREYKGLKHLLNAMPMIAAEYPVIKLLVAGDFGNDKDVYLQLIRDHKIENNVVLYDGYTPDREVEKYFAASDLVVLPYESATQSGIVQIAYAFEKPVVVTDVGGLPDVVTNGRTGYVVEPGNPRRLAEVVVSYYREQREEEFIRNVKEEAYRFSWDRMVEVIEELDERIEI